jgi:peroxiredoxin Q/BCP
MSIVPRRARASERESVLKPGARAPHFSLPTSDGGVLRSTEYLGKKPIVLYFYPKDDTPGCTVETCAFRDAYEQIVSAGAQVIWISADPVSSHRRFQDKYALPFMLASDADRRTARAYGVSKGPFGLAGRATFVIDRHGIVRDAFSSRFRVKRHVSRALDLVRRLVSETPE